MSKPCSAACEALIKPHQWGRLEATVKACVAECGRCGQAVTPETLQAALCRAEVHTSYKAVESLLGRRPELRGGESSVLASIIEGAEGMTDGLDSLGGMMEPEELAAMMTEVQQGSNASMNEHEHGHGLCMHLS